MSSATEFDVGPLTWVKGEIDQALQQARENLQHYAANPVDDTALKHAATHLHQVTGAIQMVGLEGVGKFCEELEGLLSAVDSQKIAPAAEVFAAAEQAMEALGAYLDELMDGKPDQPLRLLSAYENLLRRRGIERVSGSDLFYPDLSLRAPKNPDAKPVPEAAQREFVRSQRGRFQRGLLFWLRGESAGMKLMRQAVEAIDQAQALPAQRTFWWAAGALLDALESAGNNASVECKQLCARIDLQMRRLSEGASKVAERLLRDVLYQIALTPSATASVQKVRELFELQDYLPQAEAKMAPDAQERLAPLLRELRDQLLAAKDIWLKYSAGNRDLLKQFQQLLGKLLLRSQGIGTHPLTELLGLLGDESAKLGNIGADRQDGVALEMATALLLLENGFEHYFRLSPEFPAQAQAQGQRVQASISGDLNSAPQVDLLDEMGRKAQEKIVMAQVVSEIQVNLRHAESVLDTYFRDAAQTSEIPALAPMLRQVEGALLILEQPDAATLLHEAGQLIGSFAAGTEISQDDKEKVADALSSLGFFVETVQHGHADNERVIAPVLRRLRGEAEPEREALEEEELEIPAIESFEVTEQSAGGLETAPPVPLATALEQWNEDRSNARLKDQLHASLTAWRQDAELAGESDKSSEAAKAAQALKAEQYDEAGEMLQALFAPRAEALPSDQAVRLLDADEEAVDAELLETYLEEANEVLERVQSNLTTLQSDRHDREALTTIRRGFHTLKGSGRMVGLTTLGEVAWRIEQVLNKWLEEEKTPTPELLSLIGMAYEGFVGWVAELTEKGQADVQSGEIEALADQLLNGSAALGFAAGPSVEPAAEPTEPALGMLLEQAEEIPLAAVPPAADEWIDSEFGAVEPQPEADVRETSPAAEAAASEAVIGLEEPVTLIEGEEPEETSGLAEAVSTPLEEVTLIELPDEEEPTEAIAAVDEMAPLQVPEAMEELDFDTLIGDALSAAPAMAHEDLYIRDAANEAVAEEVEPAMPPADAAEQTLALQAEPVSELEDTAIMLESAVEELPAVENTVTETEPNEPIPFAVLPEEEIVIGDLSLSPTLFDIFNNEAAGCIRTLEQALADLRRDPTHPQTEPFVRGSHTLAGIAATTGFKPLAELGHALEHWLELRCSKPVVFAGEEVNLIDDVLIALKTMATLIAARQMPHAEVELVDRLVASLDQAKTMTAPAAVAEDLPEQEPVTEIEPLPEVDSEVQAVLRQQGEDDALRAIQDDLDEQLLPIFLEEAQELMPQLSDALRQSRGNRGDKEAVKALQRVLHTLKGSARMAGAMRVGELTHQVESKVIEADEKGDFPESLLDELEHANDRVLLMLERMQRGEPSLPDVKPEENAAAELGEIPAAEAVKVGVAPAAAVATDAGQKAVLRVPANVVDRLVNEAGEVSIARSRIEGEMLAFKQSLLDLTENVIRLRGQLREIEIQAESQMQSRMEMAQEVHAEFDPLEFDRFTRFQELTRMMAESVNDVATVQQNLLKHLDETEAALLAQGRMTRELQQELLRVRMVPLDSIAERLYRVVRQTAKELGKKANLDIRGAKTEIDRGVLEKMTAPIEHLLRNAIAHGLEMPEERQDSGKLAIGEIKFEASQQANEIVLSIRDDGKGLNYAAIRNKGLQLGLLTENEAVSDERLAELIFTPGFSTAVSVNQIAGRGIGMDVVKSEVTNLGGRIEISSTPGNGTQFTIYLPLTLAVTQAVLVSAAGQTFALPSAMVEQVQEYKPAKLTEIYTAGSVEWLGNVYPLFYLPRLLGDEEHAAASKPYNSILLLRSGNSRVAIHVDELLGNREFVVKNIGPQLARVSGIAGATVMGSGQVLLILNPVHLAAVAQQQAEAMATMPGTVVTTPPLPEQELEQAGPPVIMVVDDSLTVRKITSRLLSREGYQVVTAKDGVDALQQLQELVPAVMLVDIEMPRMDGFELTKNVRGDSRLHAVPIIMITSRTAEKHRNYAMELGANIYLGKPYQEEELLQHIKTFVQQQKEH